MNMKKILVLLLTLTMLTGAFAPAIGVFAATETSNETIKYVSLGDSMSNGLGFDKGYDKTDNPNTDNDGNNGYLEVAPDAYPAQFAAWLAGYEGEIQPGFGTNVPFVGSKGTVELTQLATSGVRAEDILYMLKYDTASADINKVYEDLLMLGYGTENQGKADYWTTTEVLWNDDRWGHPQDSNWRAASDLHNARNKEVATTIQNAVKEADIISYSGANGNFGVFFIGRVLNLVGLGDPTSDRANFYYMNFQNAVDLLNEGLIDGQAVNTVEFVETYYATMIEAMRGQGLPEDMLLEIADYLSYIAASYIVTYIQTMDYIAEVNPDADIIIMPLINNGMDFDFEITANGITKSFNAGEFMDMLYNPINDYMATYTTVKQIKGEYADMDFYYAQLPTDENGETIYVETFVSVLEELYAPVPENATIDTYPASRLFCHNRFIGDIRGFIFPILMGTEGVEFDEYDVREYEIALSQGPDAFAAYLLQNMDLQTQDGKAKWISQYLGVIDTVMTCLESVPNIEKDDLGLDGSTSMNIMGMIGPALAGIDGKIANNAAGRVEEDMVNAIYKLLVNAMVVPQLEQQGLFSQANPDLIGVWYMFEFQNFDNNLDRTLHLLDLAQKKDERFVVTAGFGLTIEALVSAHEQCLGGAQALAAIPYVPAAMEEELPQTSGLVKMLLSVYGRMKMAWGLACHPSANGHDTLAQSLINAYEDGYKVKDHMYENAFDFTLNYYSYIDEAREEKTHNLIDAYLEIYGGYSDEAKAELHSMVNSIIDRLNDKSGNHRHRLTEYVYNNDATCTANGTESATCTTCGEVLTVEVPDTATGHSFTNYVDNDDATCTANGTKTATCDHCDETDTVEVADSAKGHSFKDGSCEACGAEDPDYTPDDNKNNGDDNNDNNTNNNDDNKTPNDTTPVQQNIFVRIWNAILGFFAKIWLWFTKLF